ncbi:MAG: hypothetical protein SAK29_05750 [Scytonema sp. PMC 1069.18]|nr:hypothetical protein [Scytonema sp. PMC 1069.18]MEC4885950.1 hypothetical protein [Scytonema sp. PMC 1070.18]
MKNFSLSLYAFHLRHTLTELPGEVVADANLLWENLVKVGENSLPFIGLKDLRSQLVCYDKNIYNPKQEEGRKTEWLTLSGQSLDLGNFSTTDGFKINANLQPFLLNDTYAVDFTLVPKPSNISISIPQLKHFQPSCLLPAKIQASLGQTLWIYGEVDPSEDCGTLAEKFATALVAGTNLNPVLIKKGELFGSLLFEYQALDSNEFDNPAKQCQILIVINNNQSPTVARAEEAYDWLLKLFLSYHKILYIYQLARQRYREAREIFSNLDKEIQEFNSLISTNQTQLFELKNLIAKIPTTSFDYTRCLQDLQTHHTAITTNITNYRICLDKIQTIGSGNSPQFWQDFLNKECKKWLEQIQTDINYLTPGKELFGQLVDTIRGIVETQQAESDRTTQDILRQKEEADKRRNENLQTAIAILGFGLGAAQIGVSTAPYIIPQQQPPTPIQLPFTTSQPHPFVLSVVLSLVFGVVGAFVGWGCSHLFQAIAARRSSHQPKISTGSQQSLPQGRKQNT